MTEETPTHPIARPAATVILVRWHNGALQVYLLRRSSKSGFMAGKYVFPGGAVDSQDRETDAWTQAVDLDAEGIRRRLGGGLSVAEAMTYGVAAIRETLEEAGVFLAVKGQPGNHDMARVEDYRRTQTAGHETSVFRQFVLSENWTLALSWLTRWSHWITPKPMKKHYDTRFFLAAMPLGQTCRPDAYETTHGIWVTPKEALSANLSGDIPLSPPTVVTLHELLQYTDLEGLKKEADRRQWGKPVRPRLIPLEQGSLIVEPWDPMYHRKTIPVEKTPMDQTFAAVGQPFSRLWLSGGIWRPVVFLPNGE